MNQDEEHLRLLSIFHYVVAGFAALFSSFGLIHLVIGLMMALHPESLRPANSQPPPFFGFFFAGMGAAIVFFGWAFAGCLFYAGRCLGRRKHYTYCLVIACVACMFMPFG